MATWSHAVIRCICGNENVVKIDSRRHRRCNCGVLLRATTSRDGRRVQPWVRVDNLRAMEGAKFTISRMPKIINWILK